MTTDELIALVSWYESQCKPFLTRVDPQKVKGFDEDAQRLLALRKRRTEEVPICFLGNAAIGKSTLINALVSGTKSLLPSGGIGPLTAQATQVRYAEEPYLEVQYHPYKELWHLILALDTHHGHQLKKSGQEIATTGLSAHIDLPEEQAFEIKDELARQQVESEASDSSEQLSEQMQGKVRQASLMVTGDQDKEKDIPYLIDCLLTAAQKPSHWGIEPREEDSPRILRLSQAIAYSREKRRYRASGQSDLREFLQKLEEHASGALAPMIRELEVGWPSQLLKKGLVLVDLPGIGIAGDSYQEVTREWVRRKAKAIVMVVDRGGVNEGCAHLLYKSGFITKLHHSIGDPEAEPVRLITAVTKVDDLAVTEYEKYVQTAANPTKEERDFLSELQEPLKEKIQKQAREQLLKLDHSSHELTSQAQDRIVEELLSDMSVHPVSAPEYAKLLKGERGRRAPFIEREAESGIPGLSDSLARVADDWRTQLADQEQRLFGQFHDRLKATLNVTYTRLHEITAKEDEAEAILLKLNELLDGLRPSFHARLGKFHEFLTATLQEKLKRGVEESANAARKDLSHQVTRFDRTVHWATLRAAIRRGGVFSGSSDVDLVNTFSLTFEDPIATIWNENVLKPLRAKTAEHTKEYTHIIERVRDWTLRQELHEQSNRIQAEYEELKLTMERLQYVGDELIQDLRAEVQRHLSEEIEGAVRKGCKTFVESRLDEGIGVKGRMIDFLGDVADVITEEIKWFASRYLTGKINDVRKQIETSFTEIGDPFTLLTGIFQATTRELQEEEKEQRRLLTEHIEQISATAPSSLAFSIESQ